MGNKKQKYSEGDLFNIDLGKKGIFLGLITRRRGRTKLLSGYFWNFNNAEILKTALNPKEAVLFTKFSGLGFEIGDWKLLGKYQEWKKEEWPIPQLYRYYELSKSYFVISYNDAIDEIKEERVSEKKAKALFEDGTHGYLSLEKCLAEIISIH